MSKRSKRVRERGGTLRTLSGQFRASLADLMLKLNAASPHFVRCIKPNLEKQPGMFAAEMVAQQLRYTGVMATTQIRAEGFPLRLTFQDFIDQYVLLCPPTTLSTLVHHDTSRHSMSRHVACLG
jgi:myosin-3